MDLKQHWERVYATKASDTVSWFQEHADTSLRLIHNTGIGNGAAIIDVGGGASKLADDLLTEGYTDVTVLDLSLAAIAVTKQRLGKTADMVHWMEGDITCAEFPLHRFDIWHDRAVFHFLTDPVDRQAYVERVSRAVRPGGHVIISTFGLEGPVKCSGLDVVRYNSESLHEQFGRRFHLIDSKTEIHHTPSGAVQQFLYCHCRLESKS